MHFDRILVTTDFSDESVKAFDAAAYQAKMGGSKILLLNVFEKFQLPPELSRVIWDPNRIDAMEQNYLNEAKVQLEAIAKPHFHGIEIECLSIMSADSPAKVICKVADERDCDLIVMAGSGRGVIEHLLVGSTVSKVLNHAPCPVLVMRGKEED